MLILRNNVPLKTYELEAYLIHISEYLQRTRWLSLMFNPTLKIAPKIMAYQQG